MPNQHPTFSRRLLRGLSTSIRDNSSAFGYSIVVTADVATLSDLIGSPDVGDVYLFIFGAVVAFAVIQAAVTRMFSVEVPSASARVVALGSALSIVSISVAVGTAAGIGWLMHSSAAWAVAGFGSSSVYLLLVAVEMAIAARAEHEDEGDARDEDDDG